MKRIGHIVRKEFLQFRRDKKMFGITFVAPVIQLVLLGYAANFDVTHVGMAVCDQDRTAASRAFTERFRHTEYFDVVAEPADVREIDALIDDGHAAMALVVPRGFGRALLRRETARVQLIADGSDANAAATGLNYASLTVLRYSENVLLERLGRAGGRPGTAVPEIRTWYNPELRSRNFMVPGILALLLMVMTMMLTSLAIVKEKEQGTMEQLAVTPVRPFELILGKLVPFIVVGFVDILLVVLVARYWFGIVIAGSVPLLFGLSGVFLLTTLGLGLFVSTVAANQQQAMLSSVFFILMPMIFLSGFVFPIENMPRAVQYMTYVLPLRYYFAIIRGIFLKGVGLAVLWDEALVLMGFGVVIFTLSVLRFHKTAE